LFNIFTYICKNKQTNNNMKLKYGRTETYKHKITLEMLNKLATSVNRHSSQVLFLFQLVDGNLEKYKFLELQIKRFYINYSPGDKKEVDRILKLKTNSEKRYSNLSGFYEYNKFNRPFNISPYYKYKKIPRKLKKKYKKEFSTNKLGINSTMWYILGIENVDYRNYLITEVCSTESLFNYV